MENALPAYYRTVDPIQNLVVRVSIRKHRDAAADAAGPPFSMTASVAYGGSGAQPAFAMPSTAFEDEYAEHVVEFPWQQKVFGPG